MVDMVYGKTGEYEEDRTIYPEEPADETLAMLRTGITDRIETLRLENTRDKQTLLDLETQRTLVLARTQRQQGAFEALQALLALLGTGD